jgi:hypothetical protein
MYVRGFCALFDEDLSQLVAARAQAMRPYGVFVYFNQWGDRGGVAML